MANMQNLLFRMMAVVFRWAEVPAAPLNPPLAVTAPGGAAVEAGSSPAAAITVAGGGELHDLVERKQGILLIVLSLLVTCALQVSINPPGGVWADDNVLVDLRGNLVLKDGKPIYLGDAAAAAEAAMYPRRAGYSILARNDPTGYAVYSCLNFEIVCSSAIIIAVLVLRIRNYEFRLLVCGSWTCVTATFINLTYVWVALVPPAFADANTHQLWMHPILMLVTSPLPPMIFFAVRRYGGLLWRR